jgi:hypothetical protein
MKVYASEVLGQKTYQLKVKDPLAGGPGRATKLAEIEANAVEFAEKVLLELDIPSAPKIVLGKLRGFEDVNIDFEETTGVITVFASFRSTSGYKIRMELPIPICRGYFQRPSIAKINGKKYVFSQALLDKIMHKYDSIRPKMMNPMTPSTRFIHEENVERGLFDPPRSDTNFFDTLMDRY